MNHDSLTKENISSLRTLAQMSLVLLLVITLRVAFLRSFRVHFLECIQYNLSQYILLKISFHIFPFYSTNGNNRTFQNGHLIVLQVPQMRQGPSEDNVYIWDRFVPGLILCKYQ